jgi:hypothetical protein
MGDKSRIRPLGFEVLDEVFFFHFLPFMLGGRASPNPT